MDEEFLKLPNIQKNVLMNHSSELHMDITGGVWCISTLVVGSYNAHAFL